MSAGVDITMRRKGDTLVPTAEMFREDLQSIPEAKELLVSIRTPRSVEHHRLFFAVLHEMVKSGIWDGDVESLLDYVKVGVGHVSTVIDPSGASWVSDAVRELAEEVMGSQSDRDPVTVKLAAAIVGAGPKVYLVPKSISFASMSGDKFQRFFRRFEWFCAERMGVDIGDIVAQIMARPKELQPAPAKAITADRTRVDEPLESRLAAFAIALKKIETVEALDEDWTKRKETAEARALYQQAPQALRAIVEAAKRKALGRLSGTAFDEVANRVIEEAVRSMAA
jgi:hypothetical protein